jgi:hypothetical protein
LNPNILDHELFDFRYNIFRRDRDYQKTGQTLGGGVLVAVRSGIPVTLKAEWNSELEDLWVTVSDNKSRRKIHICCAYIPPGNNFNNSTSVFCDNTSSHILNNPDDSFVVLGDFNLSDVSWSYSQFTDSFVPSGFSDATSALAIDFISFADLKQHNGIPNAYNKVLDLVLVNNLNCDVSECMDPLVHPDLHHKPLLVKIQLENVNFMRVPSRETKQFHKADYSLINDHLVQFDWADTFCGLDIDGATERFHNILKESIDTFVPTQIIRSNVRYPSWFSRSLILVIKHKLRAHKRWKRSRLTADYDEFALLRSRQKGLQKECFDAHVCRAERTISSDPRALHGFVKSARSVSSYPSEVSFGNAVACDSRGVCELFSDFFSSTFVNTNPNMPETICDGALDISSISFDSDDILKKLKSIDLNKGPGPDGIPPLFIKNCAESLAGALCLLFKQSLREGVFPTLWKRSYITPIHKSGSKQDVQNYRPIFKLSIFSKLMERIVVEQLTLEIKPFILPNQHGFFPGRSVESNLVQYTEFILKAMGNGGQTDAIYTDFSKAFDKINHSILIHKLQTYGIHGDLLRWLKSYISGRLQSVAINNCASRFRMCPSGVPQGSHLGPVLFILYINDIGCCFQSSHFLIYADDIKIYKKISSIANCLELQSDLIRLQKYCRENQLFLNPKKCNAISFTRCRNPIIAEYLIDGESVGRCTEIRDLGVTLDTKMTFNLHIDGVVDRALRCLNFILRISKPFKSTSTIRALYQAYVRSILEFASVVWCPQYICYIDRLERVQKKMLRHLNYRCRVSFDNMLQSAHYHKIMTLENRRTVTDMCFLFKLINGLVDSSDLLGEVCFRCPVRSLRSQTTFCMPRCGTNYAQNSFLNRSTGIFNSFFNNIEINNSSLAVFKQNVRTNLTSEQ